MKAETFASDVVTLKPNGLASVAVPVPIDAFAGCGRDRSLRRGFVLRQKVLDVQDGGVGVVSTGNRRVSLQLASTVESLAFLAFVALPCNLEDVVGVKGGQVVRAHRIDSSNDVVVGQSRLVRRRQRCAVRQRMQHKKRC